MANTDTLLIEEINRSETGLVVSVVHTSGKKEIHKQINVNAKDLATIESASNPAAALTTWLQEKFPATPAWTDTLVGTTITL